MLTGRPQTGGSPAPTADRAPGACGSPSSTTRPPTPTVATTSTTATSSTTVATVSSVPAAVICGPDREAGRALVDLAERAAETVGHRRQHAPREQGDRDEGGDCDPTRAVATPKAATPTRAATRSTTRTPRATGFQIVAQLDALDDR